MDITRKAHPVLIVLLSIQRKYGKDYSFPSQKKLLSLLDTRLGVKRSRSTLNRWLRVMEDNKLSLRRKRVRRDPVHGLMFKSTLHKITIKGFYLLQAFGVDMSKEIAAYNKWRSSILPRQRSGGCKSTARPAGHDPDRLQRLGKILDQVGKNLAWPDEKP